MEVLGEITGDYTVGVFLNSAFLFSLKSVETDNIGVNLSSESEFKPRFKIGDLIPRHAGVDLKSCTCTFYNPVVGNHYGKPAVHVRYKGGTVLPGPSITDYAMNIPGVICIIEEGDFGHNWTHLKIIKVSSKSISAKLIVGNLKELASEYITAIVSKIPKWDTMKHWKVAIHK